MKFEDASTLEAVGGENDPARPTVQIDGTEPMTSRDSQTDARTIADVAGKSVPAAMLMATYQASLKTLAGTSESLTELVGRVPLKELVRESSDVIERLCIEAALELTDDNRASAAEILGLSRPTVVRLIEDGELHAHVPGAIRRKLRLAECLSGISVQEAPVARVEGMEGGFGRVYAVTLQFFQ